MASALSGGQFERNPPEVWISNPQDSGERSASRVSHPAAPFGLLHTYRSLIYDIKPHTHSSKSRFQFGFSHCTGSRNDDDRVRWAQIRTTLELPLKLLSALRRQALDVMRRSLMCSEGAGRGTWRAQSSISNHGLFRLWA